MLCNFPSDTSVLLRLFMKNVEASQYPNKQ